MKRALLAVLLCCVACGSSSATGSTGAGGGDGKVHPAPNGTHATEQAACAELEAAQTKYTTSLSCLATLRPCPDLLRVMSSATCLEYDEGSVKGCIAYYASQTTCDAVTAAIDACVVTSYPGTTSAGCK
jgi:hypothetical protein